MCIRDRSKVKYKNGIYSIDHAWASDYDEDSCKTYESNIKTEAIFCEKVENFFKLIDQKKIIIPNWKLNLIQNFLSKWNILSIKNYPH